VRFIPAFPDKVRLISSSATTGPSLRDPDIFEPTFVPDHLRHRDARNSPDSPRGVRSVQHRKDRREPAYPGISILDGKAHIPIRMDTVTREAGGECARVIAILRGKKAYLEETYHVGSIGIFGSCRRGEEHEGSDVDILVEFSEVPGIFGYLEASSGISPNFSAKKWIWSKKVHSSPASAAVSYKRSSTYDGPTKHPRILCWRPR
jgi:predicted nucleotidyltransferase